MPKQIPHIDANLVDNAVTLWREGGLVALPTETVYGLGADATNGEAVAKIYAVKSRPQFNPLIVHVADVATAQRYVEWNPLAETLAAHFWPGPLTLVLKKKSSVVSRQSSAIHDLVSAGGDTLAMRVPSHPVTLQLLRAFGGGIAAPSANRSGRISPTTAEHVREELGDAIPLIIDGGACEVGLESTVVDVTGEVPRILRAGSVTRAMIEGIRDWGLGIGEEDTIVPPPHGGRLGEWAVAGTPSPIPNPQSPIPHLSPGQLASHYAPSLPVRLNVVDVAADEALLAFGAAPLHGAGAILNLSPTGNLVEAAANLFAYLRALDDAKFSAIAVMPIPNEGIGEAINDRLTRAGAPR